MSLPKMSTAMTSAEIELDSPIKNLDIVLNYFATDIRRQSMLPLRQIIFELEKEGFKFTEGALKLIINKLIKDELVSSFNQAGWDFYILTFEGLVFQKQGGYKQKILNDTLLKRQEESNKKTQRILFWFTGIVAVGTLIAAIYYSIEIWRYFH